MRSGGVGASTDMRCPGSELNQRHADVQARARGIQGRVFARFLLERAGAVGRGWVNAHRDPTRTPTRRTTDAAGWVGWRMAARAAGASPSEAPAIESLIEALDPEVRAAID